MNENAIRDEEGNVITDAMLPWTVDSEPHRRYVEQEVKATLDGIVGKIDRLASAEQKRLEREAERLEREAERRRQQFEREQQKREREVESAVEACIEKLIKRLEREEAATRRDEEDGTPFSDLPPKTLRGRSHVFKVRGEPCIDWLDEVPSSAKNVDAEAAIRAARNEIKQAAQHASTQPVQLELSWVEPATRGKGWSTICLQLGSLPMSGF